MCPSGGAQHTYFQGSTKTNRTRASYLRSSTENDCVLTQTALSAGWGCGDQSSVMGLDFQVQAAAVSTNPTSFCSDKTLTHPTSLTCSPETWHKRPLDSTLSGEGEKHPEPLVALGPPVLCGGWTDLWWLSGPRPLQRLDGRHCHPHRGVSDRKSSKPLGTGGQGREEGTAP